MHLQQRKRAWRHWRHSSMTSFFIVVHVQNGQSFAYLWRVFGEFDPLNVVSHRADPKRHFLAWLHVIRVIVRENPPKDHFSRRVRGKIFGVISQVDGRPPVLTAISQSNGEWSNFDPSQNQIPLTDYDKTLHNRLRPWDEQVTKICANRS